MQVSETNETRNKMHQLKKIFPFISDNNSEDLKWLNEIGLLENPAIGKINTKTNETIFQPTLTWKQFLEIEDKNTEMVKCYNEPYYIIIWMDLRMDLRMDL